VTYKQPRLFVSNYHGYNGGLKYLREKTHQGQEDTKNPTVDSQESSSDIPRNNGGHGKVAGGAQKHGIAQVQDPEEHGNHRGRALFYARTQSCAYRDHQLVQHHAHIECTTCSSGSCTLSFSTHGGRHFIFKDKALSWVGLGGGLFFSSSFCRRGLLPRGLLAEVLAPAWHT